MKVSTAISRTKTGASFALLLFAGIATSSAKSAERDWPAPQLSGFVGRWQIDLSRTHMGRFGPNGQNMVRSPTFSFVFTPRGRNIAINVYEHYPQPAPTRTMAIVPDGQPHACEDKSACMTAGGDARDQSYVYRALSPKFLIRLFYVAGHLSEYSTYAVSSDGQTFTMMAWSPETPFYQNIQVFKKQP